MQRNSFQRSLEIFLVIFFLVVIIGAVFYVFNPYQASQITGYTGCTINEVFGVQCPTCGGTRAMYAVFQGNIIRAVQHNLLVVFSVPVILYYGGKTSYLVLLGEPLTRLRINKSFLWFWLVLAAVFTVLRNLL